MAAFVYNSQLDAFALYHQIQAESPTKKLGGPDLPALGHALSGATATAVANVLIYPLELVITRLKVQNQPDKTQGSEEKTYDGILDAVQKIYTEDGGLSAFYSGCLYDTGKSIADSFLFFLAYNFLRTRRQNAHKDLKSLPVSEELMVGMAAGAFGKFFTTPIQQVVTRKQTAAPGSKASLAQIISKTKAEKGIAGFWSGYSATLILTLNPSLTFLFHELFLKMTVPRSKRENPGPWLTFLLAAASKSLASTITYPFSLAKTRAQVSPVATEKLQDTKGHEKVTEKLSKVAAHQLTLFSSLVRIAHEDGILALYQGVGGEVLKGFFSHGLTMLMKERIHLAIIQLYYLILKALKKYPTPEQMAESAKEGAQAAATKGQEILQQASESTQEALSKGKKEVENLYVESKETTKSLLWGVVDDDE
ncbi:mitochondrial carrier [Pseudovirgaria hyperparasitica]|uniref:Mitochondrial carrier n=1 Tax=Pseudovirgaria hyperparasitica TaxID=470096 RepID=A0A6A6W8K9_9PEZI|nr:mitochondrial carrier [Pseudovirgaria hyperparasitica]KAF2758993.1 mitochondrial carrier [Pseudovirgaria hyperparasitica]